MSRPLPTLIRFDAVDPAPARPAGPQRTGVADYLPLLVGYPIVWGATTGDRGGYVARVPKGATVRFDAGGRPTHALVAHDPNQTLGNTAHGTLTLEPDDYGVRATIGPLPHTGYARDVAALVRGGYVTGMSFGMLADGWTDAFEGQTRVRRYTSFTVPEVSVIARPAFAETTIAAVDPDPDRNPPATRSDGPAAARNAQWLRFARVRLAAAAG